MSLRNEWRASVHRISTRLYGPSRSTSWLSWIGDEDPSHRVLVHCQQGRRRSVLVAYAVLRLSGHGPDGAARLIATHRQESELVPAYRDSVERWLRGR